MSKPELTPIERYLVDTVLMSQATGSNLFLWGYLTGGAVIAVLAGLNNSAPMLFAAFSLVFGFRLWEEHANAKFRPHCRSLMQKFKSMLDDRAADGRAQETWTAVERYFNDQLIVSDAPLEAALVESAAAGLPSQQVTSNQGKLLMLLAKISKAQKILEIGTLGGYSTIWLARGLAEGGNLISLEIDPKHAEVARGNLARAGLSEIVEVRVGDALETLPKIAEETPLPFDLIFIDADKKSNSSYLAWALKLGRPGTVIVIDNVVREGAVIDGQSADPSVQGTRRLTELMATISGISGTAIQTVGSKGYDGFAIALMLDK